MFIDWWHPNATEFWSQQIIDWMKLLDLDGLWLDMNEPSNLCLGSCGTNKTNQFVVNPAFLPQDVQDKLHAEEQVALDALGTSVPGDTRNLLYPPYTINNGAGNLSEKTAAMTAVHFGGVPHYDMHSLYGHAECSITHDVNTLYPLLNVFNPR